MKLTNLTPITSKEYQNKFGDLLWNSVHSTTKLIIGIETKWNNTKNDRIEIKTFKDNFKQFNHLFTSFYEF